MLSDYGAGITRRHVIYFALAAIAEFEPVTMLVAATDYVQARAMVPAHIRLVEMTTNDAWLRDTGPTFVVNDARGVVAGVDWEFNSWGGLNGGWYEPVIL